MGYMFYGFVLYLSGFLRDIPDLTTASSTPCRSNYGESTTFQFKDWLWAHMLKTKKGDQRTSENWLEWLKFHLHTQKNIPLTLTTEWFSPSRPKAFSTTMTWWATVDSTRNIQEIQKNDYHWVVLCCSPVGSRNSIRWKLSFYISRRWNESLATSRSKCSAWIKNWENKIGRVFAKHPPMPDQRITATATSCGAQSGWPVLAPWPIAIGSPGAGSCLVSGGWDSKTPFHIPKKTFLNHHVIPLPKFSPIPSYDMLWNLYLNDIPYINTVPSCSLRALFLEIIEIWKGFELFHPEPRFNIVEGLMLLISSVYMYVYINICTCRCMTYFKEIYNPPHDWGHIANVCYSNDVFFRISVWSNGMEGMRVQG